MNYMIGKMDWADTRLLNGMNSLLKDAEEQKKHAEEQKRIAEDQKRKAQKLEEDLFQLEQKVVKLEIERSGVSSLGPQQHQSLVLSTPYFQHQYQVPSWLLLPSQHWYSPQPVVGTTKLETATSRAGPRGALTIYELDKSDLRNVKDQAVPIRYRSRTRQILQTSQFKNWIVMPGSCELLIEGDFQPSTPHYISALSQFCATLTHALRAKDQYMSLVFFCGSHVEEDDHFVGGRAMAASLIAQLLGQQPRDVPPLHAQVQLGSFGDTPIKHLCDLFSLLVHRLPGHLSIVCLVDGLGYYETDEYEDDMLQVLRCLLSLARAGDIAATFKLLATNPTATDQIQDLFSDGGSSFLSMASLPRIRQEDGILQFE